MSVVALAPGAPELAAPEGRIISVSRVRGMGIFLLLLALIMIGPFGLAVDAHLKATFLLSAAPALRVAPLVMPVRALNIALAVVCAGLGCTLLVRKSARGAYLLFGLGVVVFIWALLTWAARGGVLNFVELLAETLVSTTPLVYGSLSGVMCERSGVVNIAIEGQFLAGAFLGAMIGSATGNLWLGVLAGAFAGAIFGALLAFLALRYGADQIIVGVVIVAFCTGLTNFLTEQVLTPYQSTLNSPSTFPPVRDPAARQDPGHRAGVVLSERFRLRRRGPAHRDPTGAVPHPLGPAGAGSR